MELTNWLLLCCCLPALLLLGIGIYALRNFPRFIQWVSSASAPNTEELHKEYEALKIKYPAKTQAELVRYIINKYAFRQGMVGALTSVGGIFALPIGLFIDMAYSARSNSELSYFIAQVYGVDNKDKTLNAGQLLVIRQKMPSPEELVLWQERYMGIAYQQLVQTVLRKFLSKIIPFAGLFIGFAVNWSSVQVIGGLTNAYYIKNARQLDGSVDAPD